MNSKLPTSPNRIKSQILFYKNISPRDLNKMTLSTEVGFKGLGGQGHFSNKLFFCGYQPFFVSMFSTDLTHHVQVSSLPAILVERCTGQDKKNGLILPAPIVKNSNYKYKQCYNSKSVQIAADFFSAGLKYKKRIFQPNTNS